MKGRKNTGLNGESSSPLYQQLFELLRDEIRGLPGNGKFHSERQLCEIYNVSQPVVRSALSMLEDEGYIERVACKGTFIRDKAGRPLSKRKLKIGVVSPLSFHDRSIEALKGIGDIALGHGMDWTFFEHQVHYDSVVDVPAMTVMLQKYLDKVDGIIWLSANLGKVPSLPEAFRKTRDRHVFINIEVSDRKYTCVSADYMHAEYALTEKVIGLGYRDIGYIGGPEERLASRLRYEGFARAMKDNGLEVNPEYVIPYHEDFRCRSRYDAALKIIESRALPRVILSGSDFIAAGLVPALAEKNYRVPGDIGVAGFDNSEIAGQMKPPLTTVQVPYYELGKTSARFLLDQVKGLSEPGSICYVPCKVVLRESC